METDAKMLTKAYILHSKLVTFVSSIRRYNEKFQWQWNLWVQTQEECNEKFQWQWNLWGQTQEDRETERCIEFVEKRSSRKTI